MPSTLIKVSGITGYKPTELRHRFESALRLGAEADSLVIGISKLRPFCRVTELLVEADKFVHINVFIEAP